MCERHGEVVAVVHGKPIDGRMLRSKFDPILARAGLPRMRLHDLRHAAVSWMLSQEVQARIVADLVGHSSTTMTLDVYGHLIEGQTRSAMSALDASLANGWQQRLTANPQVGRDRRGQCFPDFSSDRRFGG